VRWSFQGGHWSFDWAADLVAVANGFVVAGQGNGSRKGFVGWMQHWPADGPMDEEAILGMDELGDQIFEIERRDATSYWIVASDEGGSPRALLFRSFDEPPSTVTTLDPAAFDVGLARAPDEGAYVTVDGDVGTLTRVDRDGDVMWTQQYDAPVDAVAFSHALASTPSGDAIVAGTDQGDPDVQWIRRFDPDGTELWRTNVEVGAVPSKDQPLHVAVDAVDAVFVVGWSQQEGGNDGFLAKYDGDGIELWQEIWVAEGDLNVRPCDVATTSDGSIVVAGTEFLAGERSDAYWLRAYTP